MIKKNILQNGMNVITDYDNRFNTCTISYIIKTGSFYESGFNKGIAHLSEHILTANNNKYDFNDIDLIGGEFSAETYFNRTRFSINIPNKNIIKALDILTEFLFDYDIDERKLEIEKNIVKEEIIELDDNPRSFIVLKTNDVMHKNNPEYQCITGILESVNKITKVELTEFINTFYTPNNITLLVSGNVEHNDVLNYLSNRVSKFRDNKSVIVNTKPIMGEVLNFRSDKFIKEELGQTFLGWGIHINGCRTKDYYTMEIIDSLLFGGLSSRFYSDFREKNGLVYEINSYNNYLKGYASHAGSISSSTSDIHRLKEIIWTHYNDLATRFISQEELHKAKSYLNAQVLRIFDDIEDKNFIFSELVIAGIDISKNAIDEINKISIHDIADFCKKYFSKNNICFVEVG